MNNTITILNHEGEKKTIEYQESSQGTFYHRDTTSKMIERLEHIRENNIRVRFYYGDTDTGEAWGDIECGTIGRSTGRIQIPLVIHTIRSYGGGALLDHCIVKIEYANKKDGGVIYQHTRYHTREN